MQAENITEKRSYSIEIKTLAEPGLASSAFEQPGLCSKTKCHPYSFKEVLFIFLAINKTNVYHCMSSITLLLSAHEHLFNLNSKTDLTLAATGCKSSHAKVLLAIQYYRQNILRS